MLPPRGSTKNGWPAPRDPHLISHNLEEVVQIADRAVVLRQGRNVGEAPAEPQYRQQLVSMIIGGE